MIRYGSVCSGVEAATLAWKPLGWECVFVSEVEPFPCAVLQHRLGASRPIHPLDPAETDDEKDAAERRAWMKRNEKLRADGVIPNEGDFTKIGDKYRGKIDLLVGGTPCQDLSVAGLRAGFEGERSVLAIDFVRLAYQSNCRWFLWENVPGVFSSNGGGDFATLLSLFTGCEIRVPEQGFGSAGFVCNARRDRFGVAWRVLDAQYVRVPGSFPYGIPQRRRRCFIVGHLGDWRRAAEVLLEPQCMSWPAPTRRKTRKAVAGSPGGCVEDASAIRMRSGCEGGGKGALVGRELSHTLATGNDQTIVTIGIGRDVIKSGENSSFSFSIIENAQPTLTARGAGGVCIKNNAVFDTVISLASGQGGEWGCLGIDVAQTLSLNNGGFHYIACYENHANDSRVTFSGSVCPALTSRAGTGGGNLPLVMSSSELCFDVGNGQVDCSMHPLYECATTLHCMHDANAVMCVPINSMIIGKDVTLTDRQTIGIGDDGDALPTIGANHHHAVACSQYGEIAGTLTARYDSSPCIDRGQTVVASFMGGQGAAAGGIGYRKELSPTIKASPSGGNTVPDVMVASPHFELVACAIAENVINRKVQNGGNGVGAKYEVAYTLDTAGVQGVAVDVVDKQGQFMSDVVPCLTATSFKEAPSVNAFGYVRRLLPVECERLMGFPEIDILEIGKMTKDEFIAWEIATGRIIVDTENGRVFSSRTGGGNKAQEPILLEGTEMPNGYLVVSLREKAIKRQCRVHRIVWIAAHGVPQEGMTIDHINNDKKDNRLCNLQLMTPEANSSKAHADGVVKYYSKVSEEDVNEIVTLYHEGKYSLRKLAEQYGISKSRVSQLIHKVGWTQIPWNGKSWKHCPDGPRYKACGNSFCVNVVRWIGEQIERVDKMKDEADA